MARIYKIPENLCHYKYSDTQIISGLADFLCINCKYAINPQTMSVMYYFRVLNATTFELKSIKLTCLFYAKLSLIATYSQSIEINSLAPKSEKVWTISVKSSQFSEFEGLIQIESLDTNSSINSSYFKVKIWDLIIPDFSCKHSPKQFLSQFVRLNYSWCKQCFCYCMAEELLNRGRNKCMEIVEINKFKGNLFKYGFLGQTWTGEKIAILIFGICKPNTTGIYRVNIELRCIKNSTFKIIKANCDKLLAHLTDNMLQTEQIQKINI